MRFLWLLGLAVLAVAVWVDHSYFSRPIDTPLPSIEQDSRDRSLYHRKKFTVVKVVDGDTVDINMPSLSYNSTRIRLLGVDTPETAKSPAGEMYFGKEASAFTKEMVLNKRVIVILDRMQKSRDKYGRLLAYLQLEDGKILNAELIAEGMAYKDTRFEHRDYEKYLELEATAKKNKKGLWKNVTKKQLPQWLQKSNPNSSRKPLDNTKNYH